MATARVAPVTPLRNRPGWFSKWFLFPWVGSTVLFPLLALGADPAGFGSYWPVGLVASGVFAFWCFVLYFVYRGKDRNGLLRKMH